MIDAAPQARLQWQEEGQPREALWQSLGDAPPPARVLPVDDRLTADEAYGLACQGVGLLWRGDYYQARQMLTALGKRADRRARGRNADAVALGDAAGFHRYRQARAQRTRILNALLVPLNSDFTIPLRRAPDVRETCREAFGESMASTVMPLRALLGIIGAHEWRAKGIDIAAAGGRIHPHFGVFAPIRGEYVELIASTPLPAACAANGLAFDIGTGTGVLAAVLARRGFARVVASDMDPRALDCARENLQRLGLAERVDVVRADLFPEGRAALIVCNPPWVPARPSSSLEHAVYDPDSRMLRGFLQELSEHLSPGGEGWLILSDLAEHLGLRSRGELLAMIASAQLRVVDRHDTRPRHARAANAEDPLHAARAAEVTSLWRLALA